jgi:hypothetical protein
MLEVLHEQLIVDRKHGESPTSWEKKDYNVLKNMNKYS